MTEPDLDQELERLLGATRVGTEPDANARARVRAALAVGLASASVARMGLSARVGLSAKLLLLSALAVALLAGVALWGRPAKPLPVPAPPLVSSAPARAVAEPLPAPVPPGSAVIGAVVAPTASAPPPPLVSAARGFAGERPAGELTLVSSMQLALRSGNAAQVLALANEHARRFPGGALAQEREGARAIARCQLAEPAARAAIQNEFETRYASSPYAARVQAACAR